MSGPSVPTPVDAPVARASLERVISSRGFSGSPKLGAFLRFVVDETLAGRGTVLKEYSIGVGALGKPVGFDPANDSSVRVAARQLRYKLSEYFAEEGRTDPILIDLPKGAYVPVFRHRESPTELAPAPDVAVALADAGAALPTPTSAPTGILSRSRSLLNPALLIGAAVVMTAMLTWRAIGTRRPSASAIAASTRPTADGIQRPVTIVVLPFLNLSGHVSEEYVSDGITEEITATLARASNLRVVARTSAFRFKGTAKDVRTIALEVAADAVLEGSVRTSNNSYRITAQLISAADGVHLWSTTFDVKKVELFKAYDTIAQALTTEINNQLGGRIGPAAPRLATTDARAHALYLEARFQWNKRTPDAIIRSVGLYQQALMRDSMYALAYAGLADAYATMAVNSITKAGESPPKAIAAARRALAIDSTLGEPHAAIGLMRAFQDYDWSASDAEFAKALRLSPNYSTAHAWYSITLLARGRFDDAIKELDIAQQLNPLSLAHAYGAAENRFYARQWEDAEMRAKRILQMDSTFVAAYQLLGKIYAFSNRPAQSRAAFLRAQDTLFMVAYDTASNKHAEVRRRIAQLPSTIAESGPMGLAALEALIGDLDATFAWIDRAYAIRQLDLVSLKVDPVFDVIRRDPRYAARLRSIGLQ